MSYLKARILDDFKFKLTTNAEVMMLLLKLDDTKSPGPEDIPTSVLKIAAAILVPHLVSIYNLSLLKGILSKSTKNLLKSFLFLRMVAIYQYQTIDQFLSSLISIKSLKN